MMAASQTELFLEGPLVPLDRDQFVVLHGVDWKTYCVVRELFDSPGVRMTYLKLAALKRYQSRLTRS